MEWDHWTWPYNVLVLQPINLLKKCHGGKGNMKLWTLKWKLISKQLIIINDNPYSKPYDKSNDNKQKKKKKN